MNVISLHAQQSETDENDTEKKSHKSLIFPNDDDLDLTSDRIDDDIDLFMPKDTAIANLPLCPSFKSIPNTIYLLLSDPTSSKSAFIISIIITTLIIASCITFILESMQSFKYPKVGTKTDDTLPIFVSFEFFAIVTFTIEYLLRLIFAHSVDYIDLGYTEKIKNNCCCKCNENLYKTWLFMIQSFNIIDLLAILPFYVSILSRENSDIAKFSFIRILRLARVFRVFKLGKYTEGVVIYSQVFKKSAEALYLLLFFSLVTSIVMGSFIYYFEKGEWTINGCSKSDGVVYSCFTREDIVGNQREESPYYSIPQSIWWVFTTITTVGYGDIYPTSFMGKIIAILTMHVGILGIALPISIIGANFREIYDVRQQRKSDLKMKTRMSQMSQSQDFDEIEALDEMKNSLNDIVSEIKNLQIAMKRYEELVKKKKNF